MTVRRGFSVLNVVHRAPSEFWTHRDKVKQLRPFSVLAVTSEALEQVASAMIVTGETL
jgi:hypothetical protein